MDIKDQMKKGTITVEEFLHKTLDANKNDEILDKFHTISCKASDEIKEHIGNNPFTHMSKTTRIVRDYEIAVKKLYDEYFTPEAEPRG